MREASYETLNHLLFKMIIILIVIVIMIRIMMMMMMVMFQGSE